ncbi:hypothetical protein AMTR_s00007p00262130 [Amborella trichopoda]|uniref:Uncharacterized protein n=1 Tax=Amborella trichopoda TaxID=13333 RepID=W1PC44_AMBTC|nr:hypothetical protein AMTR_s00007p00262130 [Amborella trichopoda]
MADLSRNCRRSRLGFSYWIALLAVISIYYQHPQLPHPLSSWEYANGLPLGSLLSLGSLTLGSISAVLSLIERQYVLTSVVEMSDPPKIHHQYLNLVTKNKKVIREKTLLVLARENVTDLCVSFPELTYKGAMHQHMHPPIRCIPPCRTTGCALPVCTWSTTWPMWTGAVVPCDIPLRDNGLWSAPSARLAPTCVPAFRANECMLKPTFPSNAYIGPKTFLKR